MNFRYLLIVLGCTLWAQTQGILPLSGVRQGQRGVGKSVFQGSAPEEFQVEILGVLENIGPRQNIILARLSGGPLEKTGVMQGMSGSPVWIDGKLIGAVALAFPFSKEPIAGIRPIEEMLALDRTATVHSEPAEVAPAAVRDVRFGESRLVEVATPVSFSGFTSRTIEHFAPQWRKLGLEPLQGIGGQASAPARGRVPQDLEPGSMISIQLITGDWGVGADGTVTMIDRDRIYAFGHRFLGLGSAEMPFSRSEVIALLPNLASSFKISASRDPLGTITQDGNTAIGGVLRRTASMIPVKIDVAGSSRRSTYRMEMISNPTLTPFLLQMALFSAIDGTERTLGSSTLTVNGDIRFDGDLPPLKIQQALSGDFNAPVLASFATASPLAALLQNGSDQVRVTGIDLAINATETRKLWQIEHLSASRREMRPGETVRLAMVLSGPGDRDEVRHVDYSIPVGTPPGTLFITAADALNTNLAENRLLLGSGPRPTRQMLAQLNSLRGNSSAWLRIWRQDSAYSAGGTDLTNLPAGLSMLFARVQMQQPMLGAGGAKLFETEIPLPGSVVGGTKTIQLEVKE